MSKPLSRDQVLKDPAGALALDPDYTETVKLVRNAEESYGAADRAWTDFQAARREDEDVSPVARLRAAAEARLEGRPVGAGDENVAGIGANIASERRQWAAALEVGRKRAERARLKASVPVCAALLPHARERCAQRARLLLDLVQLDDEEEAEGNALDVAGVSRSTLPNNSTRRIIGNGSDLSSLLAWWLVESCRDGLLSAESVPPGPLHDYVAAKTREP